MHQGQMVKILNSEGKFVAYARPQCALVRLILPAGWSICDIIKLAPHM